MAQAPSTRKTTTYKTFSTMDSQNERFGVEKDEFFFLENIMRVSEGRLRSVMGPSAVVADFPPTGSVIITTPSLNPVVTTSGNKLTG